MKKLITILAALAVSVSFATAADEAKKDAAKGDKKAGAEERFKKLDTNGDGSISADEFKASPQGQKDAAKAEAFFKAHDKDNDGKLSADEFNAGGGKKGDAKPGEPKKGDAKKGDAATKVEPAKAGTDAPKPATENK